MSKLIANIQPSPFALTAMRDSTLNAKGGRWAAYQNHEIGHPDGGRLKFLCVGPNCTLKEAPGILPDSKAEINWRYVHVGFVDLKTGQVVELEAPAPAAPPAADPAVVGGAALGASLAPDPKAEAPAPRTRRSTMTLVEPELPVKPEGDK